jgi:hypothetical protein
MLLVAAGAVLLATVHIRHRPATLCPLRAVTGLPCPFCGGTTAVARLGRGDVVAAVRASPLGTALVGALPFVDLVRRPRRWRADVRIRVIVVTAVLLASEVWQLHRFGLLGT